MTALKMKHRVSDAQEEVNASNWKIMTFTKQSTSHLGNLDFPSKSAAMQRIMELEDRISLGEIASLKVAGNKLVEVKDWLFFMPFPII